MTHRLLVAALALAAFPATAQTPDQTSPATGPAAPGTPRAAPAQGDAEVSKNAPVNGVLVLYGNQRCPTNKDGAEVTVCVRRGAEEQFRIPKELRELEVTPQNESWTARSQDTLDAGASGIGSCTVSGAGGDTGCFAKQARAYKRAACARYSTYLPRA